MSADANAIVLYDGTCRLCNASVQYLLRWDRRGTLRFASLQSAFARDLLQRLGMSGRLPDSIVVVEGGSLLVRSAAGLAICRHLRMPWPLFRGFVVVPRFLRDLVYDWVARNRQRWFGREPNCALPRPEWRERFLDADEG